MNGSDTGHIIFDIQVERVNRTDYILTGNITFRSTFTKNPNAYYVSVCVISTSYPNLLFGKIKKNMWDPDSKNDLN